MRGPSRLALVGLVPVVVLLSQSAQAQTAPIDAGNTIVGGGFSLMSTGGDLHEERATTIALDPSLAIFVARGLALGGEILFERASQRGLTSTRWGIGPSVTYYFPTASRGSSGASGAIYPYVGASFLYTKLAVREDGAPAGLFPFDVSVSRTSSRLRGGVLYMLSGAVGIFVEGTFRLNRLENTRENQAGVITGFRAFLN